MRRANAKRWFPKDTERKMTQCVLSAAVVIGAIRVIQYGIQSYRKESIE